MQPELDPLPQLPPHDVSATRAAAIRRQAHQILNQRELAPDDAPAHGWARAYHRFVEPATLMALGLSYLLWTVHDTVALFR